VTGGPGFGTLRPVMHRLPLFSIIAALACAQPAARAVAAPPQAEATKAAMTAAAPAVESEAPKAKGAAADPLKVGDDAPTFAMKTANPELSKLKMFSVARFVGVNPEEPKSALVLSFAASYCEPCKKELAQLRNLQERFTKAGVLLAVVVIDTEPEGIEAMRKLTVDELKLGYPVLSDRFGVVARRYRANPLPYTVIIDKKGTVQWVHSGFAEGSLEELAAKAGI
jgi:alkyl hydroperoxide reductase subunit AhpC